MYATYLLNRFCREGRAAHGALRAPRICFRSTGGHRLQRPRRQTKCRWLPAVSISTYRIVHDWKFCLLIKLTCWMCWQWDLASGTRRTRARCRLTQRILELPRGALYARACRHTSARAPAREVPRVRRMLCCEIAQLRKAFINTRYWYSNVLLSTCRVHLRHWENTQISIENNFIFDSI